MRQALRIRRRADVVLVQRQRVVLRRHVTAPRVVVRPLHRLELGVDVELPPGLEQQHLQPLLGQHERGHPTGGTGPDDDGVVGLRQVGLGRPGWLDRQSHDRHIAIATSARSKLGHRDTEIAEEAFWAPRYPPFSVSRWQNRKPPRLRGFGCVLACNQHMVRKATHDDVDAILAVVNTNTDRLLAPRSGRDRAVAGCVLGGRGRRPRRRLLLPRDLQPQDRGVAEPGGSP